MTAPPATGADREWLTPGVRGIGAASLLADLGHEVPTSLLPSFLTSTLGAPAAALGVIEGVSDGLAGAARLGGGARQHVTGDTSAVGVSRDVSVKVRHPPMIRYAPRSRPVRVRSSRRR